MSESYCLVLKFYKDNELVLSKFVEAQGLRDISDTFDLTNYDKLVISGYYFEPDVEVWEGYESDDSNTVSFTC